MAFGLEVRKGRGAAGSGWQGRARARVSEPRAEPEVSARCRNVARLTASAHGKLFVFCDDRRPRSFDNANDILPL